MGGGMGLWDPAGGVWGGREAAFGVWDGPYGGLTGQCGALGPPLGDLMGKCGGRGGGIWGLGPPYGPLGLHPPLLRGCMGRCGVWDPPHTPPHPQRAVLSPQTPTPPTPPSEQTDAAAAAPRGEPRCHLPVPHRHAAPRAAERGEGLPGLQVGGWGGGGGGYKSGSGGCGGTACCTQVLELLECIPPLLLLLVACGLDHALSSALSVIRQHSFVQYSFRSELQPHSTPGWGGLGKGGGWGGG